MGIVILFSFNYFICLLWRYHIKILVSFLIVVPVILIYPTHEVPTWSYSDKTIIYDDGTRPEYHFIDIDSTYYIYASGWQLEYFTNEWWDGPKSPFWWECYNTMSDPKNQNYIDHVYFLNDTAGILLDYTYKPEEITFKIEMNAESEIEIAKVYYQGYRITLENENGIKELPYYAKEGFITIKTNESGTVRVVYVGTPLTRISIYLCYLGVGISWWILMSFQQDKKWRKKISLI